MAGMTGVSLLLASSAGWLTGCSPSDEMVVGLGPQLETATAQGQSSAQAADPSQSGSQSHALVVTPRQRAYLEALKVAGVTPSSELTALSIGSYVCQARAASHTDQAVWDFVEPLVRDDFTESDNHDGPRSMEPSVGELRSATSDYIRIATGRLC